MAFVVRKAGYEVSEEELIAYTKSRIMAFKCPSEVRFLDALPKTLIGKVQKKELRKMV